MTWAHLLGICLLRLHVFYITALPKPVLLSVQSHHMFVNELFCALADMIAQITSITLRSGEYGGQSGRTLMQLLLNASIVVLAICGRALSCWSCQPCGNASLAYSTNPEPRIILLAYFSAVTVPSMKTIGLLKPYPIAPHTSTFGG